MNSEPQGDGDNPNDNGFRLFLRFADGCRHQLEHTRQISHRDNHEIRSYLYGSGPRPRKETLKRVYHVAYPGLKRVQSRLGKQGMFDPEVVREFYSRDHNRMMFERGNLICIAYPAHVRKARQGMALVELEPITGRFELETDIPLRRGDWVILHRMSIIERVEKPFAESAASFLRGLGLDRERLFPDKAYKYLTGLRYSSIRRQ